MSMIGILLRVTNHQLETFINDSSLLEQHVDSEEMEYDESKLDLDKSWDAINYLLTGHSSNLIEQAQPPISWVVFSGQILDENQDMGYGPAQYLSPPQVKAVNEAISNISSKSIRQRFKADNMNKLEVYPGFWQDNEDEKDYLEDIFNKLKDFYSKAAKEEQAIITYIT